jgi:hypothetical protein
MDPIDAPVVDIESFQLGASIKASLRELQHTISTNTEFFTIALNELVSSRKHLKGRVVRVNAQAQSLYYNHCKQHHYDDHYKLGKQLFVHLKQYTMIRRKQQLLNATTLQPAMLLMWQRYEQIFYKTSSTAPLVTPAKRKNASLFASWFGSNTAPTVPSYDVLRTILSDIVKSGVSLLSVAFALFLASVAGHNWRALLHITFEQIIEGQRRALPTQFEDASGAMITMHYMLDLLNSSVAGGSNNPVASSARTWIKSEFTQNFQRVLASADQAIDKMPLVANAFVNACVQLLSYVITPEPHSILSPALHAGVTAYAHLVFNFQTIPISGRAEFEQHIARILKDSDRLCAIFATSMVEDAVFVLMRMQQQVSSTSATLVLLHQDGTVSITPTIQTSDDVWIVLESDASGDDDDDDAQDDWFDLTCNIPL